MPDAATGGTALVTGAGGFVGAEVAHRLAMAGYDVHGCTRRAPSPPDVVSHALDLADAAGVMRLFTAVQPDVVVHCAASSSASHHVTADEDGWRDTVGSTAVVAQACRDAGVRHLVHLGSALEYGPSRDPLVESAALRPNTVRGRHKAEATAIALSSASATLAVTVLRPFRVFGPGEPADRLVPRIIRSATQGEPLRLPEQPTYRDYVHVVDVADACALAARRIGAPLVINIATGIQTSVFELVELVQQLWGSTLPLSPEPFPARGVDEEPYLADASRAREVLGWSPTWTLSAGMADLLARARLGEPAHG